MVNRPGIVSNAIETATIRRLRIRLLPFLFALYVAAFIDRINLGFAALTMKSDLAITSQQFLGDPNVELPRMSPSAHIQPDGDGRWAILENGEIRATYPTQAIRRPVSGTRQFGTES
jgi:hypothetical protein